MTNDSISWGELAELTHETQVERFGFCTCEEQENFPYVDCPRVDEMHTTRQLIKRAREQRNASTNDKDFDYWHEIMVQYQNKLKTGANK
jgi:hypothetical protein